RCRESLVRSSSNNSSRCRGTNPHIPAAANRSPHFGNYFGRCGDLPLLPPAAEGASAYRLLPWKGVEFSDIFSSFLLILQPCVFALTLLLIILSVARFLFGVPLRK